MAALLPEPSWLNLTNAAMGVAVLACAALILGLVLWEFAKHAAHGLSGRRFRLPPSR